MRRIQISDEVWDEIAKHGKFGETEDDVLRRILGIGNEDGTTMSTAAIARPGPRTSRQFSKRKMHADVHSGQLVVFFHDDGTERRWDLPDQSDKAEIRRIRDEAVKFALENGASDPGQTNAVRKALTNAGYHLIK